MARSHPHPDNERERFPVAWEDDDTAGLSINALTRKDVEAILASLPDEPDDEPPLRLPSLQQAAAQRWKRRAYGTPGATAEAEYQRRRHAEHAAWARTRPLRIAATMLAGIGGLLVAAVAGLPWPAAPRRAAVARPHLPAAELERHPLQGRPAPRPPRRPRRLGGAGRGRAGRGGARRAGHQHGRDRGARPAAGGPAAQPAADADP
jgi:hypothetical protein